MNTQLWTVQTRTSRLYFYKEANYYQCTQEGGKQAILTYKGEKTDSKGYTKRTYRSSESDCKDCPLREQCCGKATKFNRAGEPEGGQ
ncbi:hypothetical protein GOQ04_23835 [Emticicia sp. ODNR4P]|nr:hypothetical protein [Emticicia sp. ODNR4P]